MREFLFSLFVCSAWLAVGLLADDYVKLRDQVVYIKAVQKAHGSLHEQQDRSNSRDGPQAKGGKEPKDPTREEPKWTDVWLALLTFALAVGTIALFWDAREKGRKELRAYLGIPQPAVVRLGVINHFQVQVTITNSGKTPAKNVRKWIKSYLADKGEQMVFSPAEFDEATNAIPPDSRWHLRQDFTKWDDATLTAIARFEKTLHVWGQITYTDIYDKPHTTDFRLETYATRYGAMESDGGQVVQIITGWDLEAAVKGNDLT